MKHAVMQSSPLDTAPYRIEFENLEHYLYVFVTGRQDTLAVSKQFWGEIAAAAERLEQRKILVEEDFPNKIPDIDLYALIEYLTTIGLRGKTIAFVDREISQRDSNAFAGLMALNRALYGRIFNTRAEAAEWLLGG